MPSSTSRRYYRHGQFVCPNRTSTFVYTRIHPTPVSERRYMMVPVGPYADGRFDTAHKELTAVFYFLKANAPFLQEYSNVPWKLFMDNLPAICYLNRSTVRTDAVKANIVAKIFNVLREYEGEITFHHVVGKDNCTADELYNNPISAHFLDLVCP
eukprot:Lankesteria_metandrocarpae@DN7674_c0_g1_i1.p1